MFKALAITVLSVLAITGCTKTPPANGEIPVGVWHLTNPYVGGTLVSEANGHVFVYSEAGGPNYTNPAGWPSCYYKFTLIPEDRSQPMYDWDTGAAQYIVEEEIRLSGGPYSISGKLIYKDVFGNIVEELTVSSYAGGGEDTNADYIQSFEAKKCDYSNTVPQVPFVDEDLDGFPD